MNHVFYNPLRWMETILKRMTHHLKTFVHRLDSSEEDLQDKMSQIEAKLNGIGASAEEVFQTLTDKIDQACEDVYQQFREHLMTRPSKTQITNWTLPETPSIIDFTTWTDIKMEIYERTSNRISKELVRWEDQQGFIQEIEKTILTEIQLKLNILNGELADVDEDLMADNKSTASDDSAQNPFGTMRKRLSVGNARRATLPGIMVYADDHLSVPLIAQILSPLSNAMGNLVTGRNRLADYEKNRTRLAREKSERYYNYILNTKAGNDFLRKFVNALFDQCREKLGDIRDKIPAIIRSDRKVMDHVLRCRRDTKVSIELYEEMMNGLEDLKQQLTEYGEGEIFVDDFRNADIRISDSGSSSGSQSIRISNFIENSSKDGHTQQTGETRALWTILQNGNVRKEDDVQETRVFIRIYMKSSGVQNVTSEVSKLRYKQQIHS